MKHCPAHRRQRTSDSRNNARSEARERHEIVFAGVDGEGVERPDGAHEYVLLSVGERSLFHDNGRKLTTDEIFDFLYECFLDQPASVFVGFFLGYDFAHWIRDLPEERARQLLLPEGIEARRPARGARRLNPTPFPVRWGRWEFDLLPNGKRFKLRPTHVFRGRCAECGRTCDGSAKVVNRHPWLYVCDAGSMFQTSFLKAIDPGDWREPICSPEEFETVKAGKADRGAEVVAYGTPIEPTMIAYNVTENVILSRLMDRVNLGLVEMGVKLTRPQWHGPGQAAQAWLKSTAPDHSGEACFDAGDREAFDAARRSYFGGWFEIPVHGLVPGETYEDDVNSAYPAIIATLPCLLHGSWRSGEGRPPKGGRYCLVEASVSGSDPFLGAMTHRTPTGRVLRPHKTAGWYWRHELEAARRAGLVDRVRYRRWWIYDPCDCAPPFAAVAGLYSTRIRVGKKSPHGRALRLVYNSVYGKMAQSIGDPLFGNPVYASLITAGCRTMILEAIASHPDRSAAVVMIATDGVYFRTRHPSLDVDPERLGAWSEAMKTNLSLLKPGVYWDDQAREAVASGGKLGLKSRGVNERALAREVHQIDRLWKSFDPTRPPGLTAKEDVERWPSVNLTPPFAMISPRQALRRGKWNLVAVVERAKSVRQSAAPHAKRLPVRPDDPRADDGLIRSRPWPTGPSDDGIESTPYDKHFGLEDTPPEETRAEVDGPLMPEAPYAVLVREIFGNL